MDIYEILSEAKHGDIEKATKQLIEFMSERIEETGLDYRAIAAKLATGGLYNDEEIKRIAVVEFVSDFIKNHKAEIESNYNLLPLTNDNEIMGDISKMRNNEISSVTKGAVKRPGSLAEAELRGQISSKFDTEFNGYLEAEKDDQEYLSILKAFDQNREGLKRGVTTATVEKEKEGLGDYLSDTFEENKENISKVDLSIGDIQTQLDSNPIWQKVTTKVPSDEIYELMGKVLAKKNLQTR